MLNGCVLVLLYLSTAPLVLHYKNDRLLVCTMYYNINLMWMKVEQILPKKLCIAQRKQSKANNNEVDMISSSKTNSIPESEICNHSDSESFKMLVETGLPCNIETVEEKLCWVRSQIIGNDVEFNSPFGRRKLVYADHTASGRSLHYIENFIANHLLPFYGTSHHLSFTIIQSLDSFPTFMLTITPSIIDYKQKNIKIFCY